MRDAQEWDDAFLLQLIAVGEQESLTLDYKASAALAKTDLKKKDISKDVSAFANSAGGFLVYGMLENKHIPTSIDVGADRNVITKEWLESVIKSTIQPTVEGIVIKSIQLPSKGPDKVCYVVQIPQATSRAPHQASDYRYYKRFNFESAPMEDYEVRDLVRRSIEYGKKYAAAWNLEVEINRLTGAITERVQIGNGVDLPRARLMIPVSDGLRSSGNSIVVLPKALREKVTGLIARLDRFNSVIETTDPGQRENARLNVERKTDLTQVFLMACDISTALEAILDAEP
jgi:hypothetical protein